MKMIRALANFYVKVADFQSLTTSGIELAQEIKAARGTHTHTRQPYFACLLAFSSLFFILRRFKLVLALFRAIFIFSRCRFHRMLCVY